MNTYTLHVSYPTSLPTANPAGWDATMRDIIELWHDMVHRAGWSPIGESVDVALDDAPFGEDQHVVTISGRIEPTP